MSRIIKKKHFTIAIEKPIVIHENEIINIEELKNEIEFMKFLDKKNAGLYVYKEGHNYPESSAYEKIHVWSNAENVLKYILKWTARYNGKCAKIVMHETIWGFEEIKEESK